MSLVPLGALAQSLEVAEVSGGCLHHIHRDRTGNQELENASRMSLEESHWRAGTPDTNPLIREADKVSARMIPSSAAYNKLSSNYLKIKPILLA